MRYVIVTYKSWLEMLSVLKFCAHDCFTRNAKHEYQRPLTLTGAARGLTLPWALTKSGAIQPISPFIEHLIIKIATGRSGTRPPGYSSAGHIRSSGQMINGSRDALHVRYLI